MKKLTVTRGKSLQTGAIVFGLVFAAALSLPIYSVLGVGSSLRVYYSIDMANSGVAPNARGKIDGTLSHSATGNSQQLKLSLSNLNPNTTYRLMAFIGDEVAPRSVTDLTTDASGALAVTYAQKCPSAVGQSSLPRGGGPVPEALDPISRIHQLDIVKDGNVILTGVIGADLQADCTGPSVSSTAPAPNATGVPRDQTITVTFDEAMNPTTVTKSTFTLKQGTKTVPGTVTCNGVTAIFKPTTALAGDAVYTATITTRAKDQNGNALANNFVWTFSTGGPADTTPPTVTSTTPSNGDTGVALAATVTATFSEAIDPATINETTFTLTGAGGTPVSGTVNYNVNSHTASFAPASALSASTTFTATLTTGAKDVAGNVLASAVVWNFTTAVSDNQPPSVGATVPASGETGVALGQVISATFSEAMNASTIDTGTFSLSGPGGQVNGTVVYDANSRTASFTPASLLAPNVPYTAVVSTGARDLSGNSLANDFVWSFTTVATPTSGRIDLGYGTNVAVLAGVAVVSTGNTLITGAVGVSPGTDVTGFPPGVIDGELAINANGAPEAMAMLITAYNDAATRTVGAVAISEDIGGQTFNPGLYHATSSLGISSGDVVLDAQGDEDAVFIFQIPATLTSGTGRQVILSGGAKANNVFWQVGESATVGAGSAFSGNIMAHQSVAMGTGATLLGRALAMNGTVTLDSNTITKP
jgi:Ice-binding-like/Bacterial Ig-like domain